jgi:hypothetical protein
MKLTYLFGAGASSATLPLAAKLGEDMGSLARMIGTDLMRRPERTLNDEMTKSMYWLSHTALNHNTIDTIARKLWMRSDPESMSQLRRLKATLAAYLWYKQIVNPSDRRYDTFFATILQKVSGQGPSLPPAVRILTWNYDLLIERSFYEYCLDYRHTTELLASRKGVIHLNGYAGVEARKVRKIVPNDYSKFEFALFEGTEDKFADVLQLYSRCMSANPLDRLETKIAFAWENSAIISEACNVAAGTTILVVVGYSFPYFNREADKALLRAIVPTCEAIYLQTSIDRGPRERMKSILSQLQSSRNWEELINNIGEEDYIHIPNELIQ